MTVFNASLPAGEDCALKFIANGMNLAGASVQWRLCDLESNDEVIVKAIGDGVDILSTAEGILEVVFDTTGLSGSYEHECELTDADNNTVMIANGILAIG